MSTPEQSEGQLSEVGRLDPAEADLPIQPDQAVAGAPEGESGEVDEGRAGPNARTGSDDEEHRAIAEGRTILGGDTP